MADEDKEKAEKVAAAKKRYEQLKKQKAKKAGTGKKKDEKAEGSSTVSKPEDKTEDKTEDAAASEPVEATSAPTDPVDDDEEPTELPKSTNAPSSHARTPSVAIESRQRSASFYRTSGTPTSPTAMTPSLGVSSDIYREQAQRIEELDKENKRLTSLVEEGQSRWKRTEEELEELREGRGDIALAAEKGREAEKLKAELEALKRQLAQLQSQSIKTSKKAAGPSPAQSDSIDDLNAQVASKTATIESLESEISSLNKQLGEQTNKTNELQARISSLESLLQKAEQEASSTKTELSDLKSNLEKADEQAAKEGSDRDTARSRIAQLEAELGAANRKASDSLSRAELLEKKVETLTQLHRDNDARNQARLQEHKKTEREAAELRTRVTGLSNENARLREAEQRRRKADLGSIEDSSVQELVDEERDRLLAKVRELEEENFELRRGVWRDRRAAMQPGMDDGADAVFDDIDLSGNTPTSRRQTSSLQDVIQSGISAFTGKPHPHAPHRRSDAAHQPQPGAEVRERQGSLASLGTLDSFEFDEEAFRKAQEEEGKKRIERIREVKRGLVQYKGWRADFVDIRVGMGGVFDI